jgi:hemolysin III
MRMPAMPQRGGDVEWAARPLLRGWLHAAAGVGALVLAVALAWQSRFDPLRLVTFLIFCVSMMELYAVSAVYHIGAWRPRTKRVLRALDHANIFVLIAATYTPLCFNVLSGWTRGILLTAVWLLALAGIVVTLLLPGLPRRFATGLYVGMGWVALLALPALAAALSWAAIGVLLLGGVLYTIGGVVYARRRPDPFPRVFGFHEVFHLFVVAGSVAFAVIMCVWVLPFPRV